MFLSTLNAGYYYQENSIYYKCMDNCLQCDNDSECKTCDTGYVLVNKKCFQEITNCVT